MSDVSKSTSAPIILGEVEPKARQASTIIGNDALSALNICFVLTTLAGVASESFGTTAAAVASMLVFLVYGFVFRKSIPSIERFADSTYYQGFILTLFALLIALTGKGADSLTSSGIIQQFGTAIWTTFIGMSGRIVIIQFLTTARDQEDEARDAISIYVTELHKEIETTVVQLRRFRETVLVSASKISDDLADEAKKSRKENSDAVRSATAGLVRSVEQSTTKLDQSVERLAERIGNLDIPSDVLADQIRKIADAMREDLGRVRKEMEENSSSFADMQKDNIAVLEATRGDLSQLRTSLADVNNLIAEASKTTSASLNSTRDSLNASVQAAHGVEQLGRTAELLADRLRLLSNMFDERARSYNGEFEKVAREIAEAASQAREAATQARNETTGVANALAESAKKITDAIKDVRRLDEGAQ